MDTPLSMKYFVILKLAAVFALVVSAAVLSTPRGRLPLALRGIRKMLRKDRDLPQAASDRGEAVSFSRKLVAFLLVLIAFALALTF